MKNKSHKNSFYGAMFLSLHILNVQLSINVDKTFPLLLEIQLDEEEIVLIDKDHLGTTYYAFSNQRLI